MIVEPLFMFSSSLGHSSDVCATLKEKVAASIQHMTQHVELQ